MELREKVAREILGYLEGTLTEAQEAADDILAIPEIRDALAGKRSYGVNASLDSYVLIDPPSEQSRAASRPK